MSSSRITILFSGLLTFVRGKRNFSGVSYHLSKRTALRLNADTFPATLEESAAFTAAGVNISSTESVHSELARSLFPHIDALLVVSAKIKRDSIDELKNCKVIVRYGSGTDNIDVEYASEKGIVVANVPDFCLSEVADHTMALLLASARKLIVMDRHTRLGNWRARSLETVRRISGKTLGLLGFGSIAQQVARRALAFDMKVITYDPFIDKALAKNMAIDVVELDRLLRVSDFISLHVPLNIHTRHIIGEAELRKMKPESILINTGRGGLVDEVALVRALTEGWIGAAGIDVYETLPMFDPEPVFVQHPLFDLHNVTLTPHTAGTSVESLEQLMLAGARQAIAVLDGQAPDHWVNPTVIPKFPLNVEELK
jgi:D-3-phosphoglycerate dehydrogenase